MLVVDLDENVVAFSTNTRLILGALLTFGLLTYTIDIVPLLVIEYEWDE